MPAKTRYSARRCVRRCLGPGSDGSALEAFRPTLVLCGSGGGAAGLTRPVRRSGGEARAEALRLTAAEVDPVSDDFAIVTAIGAADGPDDQAQGKRAKARGHRAQVGLWHPSM